MKKIWLGRYAGYPWSVAFSTQDAAHAWMSAGEGRETTTVPLDPFDAESRRGAGWMR